MALSLCLDPPSELVQQQAGVDSNNNLSVSNSSGSNTYNNSDDTTTTPTNDHSGLSQVPPVGGAKRKPSRRANTAERRATHNAVERQRRETLNGRFLVCSLSRSLTPSNLTLPLIRTWPHSYLTFPKSVVPPSPPSSILPSHTFKLLVATDTSLPASSNYSNTKETHSVVSLTNGVIVPVSQGLTNLLEEMGSRW